MHAKPDLRVFLKVDDHWFGLGDRGRYGPKMGFQFMNRIKSHLPANGNPLEMELSRLRKTYSTDPVTIDGIVDVSHQSDMNCRVFGGGYRIHTFSFSAWKMNGETRTDKLLLSRAIPNRSGFKYRLAPNSHHSVQVLLSADETRAVVLKGVETSGCPEDLSLIAESLNRPITIEHERLGKLALDRTINFFTGAAKWDGSAVFISIPASDDKFAPKAIALAQEIFQREKEINQIVSKFFIESVTSELDDCELDSATLESLSELLSIEFTEFGLVEFWYGGDDDILGGHSLVVRFDSNEDLTFSIEG